MLDELAKLIRDVGFPAAVAGYVLVRLDGTLREVLRELRAVKHELHRLRTGDTTG